MNAKPVRVTHYLYYIARQLVALYDAEKNSYLRVAVLNYLERASEEQLRSLRHLLSFMIRMPGMSEELKTSQGVLKPEKEWTEEETLAAEQDIVDEVVRVEWRWAVYVANAALMRKSQDWVEEVPGWWEEFKQSARGPLNTMFLPGNIYCQTVDAPDEFDAVLRDYRDEYDTSNPKDITPHIYHVARQLVAAYDKEKGDLRVAVFDYLEAASEEELGILRHLFIFMTGLPGMEKTLKESQGVLKPEVEWTMEERSLANSDMTEEVVREDWEWAGYIAWDAWSQKKHGDRFDEMWGEFKQSARDHRAKRSNDSQASGAN